MAKIFGVHEKAPIIDWISYTAVFTGWGTVTVQEMFYCVIADKLYIKGKFTSGTPTAVEARISYPTGFTSASSSKMAATVLKAGTIGVTFPVLVEPNVAYMTIGGNANLAANITKQTGTGLGASAGDVLTLTMDVPIAVNTSNDILRPSDNTKI